jgi:ubiquinone/menaquinone biosynthesis C-methylase UbiE
LLLAIALLAIALPAQVAEKANERYQTSEGRAGIAKGLGSPDRVERQKPAELVASLGIKVGQVVADVGTGVGFMLPYFVAAVGSSGKVYAQDIQEDFLNQARSKIQENGWTNVETVLGEQTDVRLPENSIDLAFILDAYHHFTYPGKTVATVRSALKPGGRLVVVDFYRSREHPSMSEERLKDHIRLDRDGFAAEIRSVGFDLVRQYDHLPYQYVLIFQKGGGAARADQ